MVKPRLQAWLSGQTPRTVSSLPEIEAPSLDDLRVELDPPAEITKPELLARYEQLIRARSARRPRAGGERVGAGDDVVVDVVGWCGGHLLPLSTHAGLGLAALPSPPLPTFGPGLVGQVVGGRGFVDLMLPFDYPVVELRGEIARFDVGLRAASEVFPLDPEGPDFIPTLNLGPTLDQVMSAILAEMQAERIAALRDQALQAALDLLCQRAPVSVPPALVDEELWRRWAEHEGPQLLARDVPEAELKRAQDAWVSHPGLRADALRRLHVAVVLGAIARRDRIAPDAENSAPYLAQMGAALGLDLEQTRDALRQDPAQAQVVFEQIHHLLVVDHVRARVRLHVRGAGEISL